MRPASTVTWSAHCDGQSCGHTDGNVARIERLDYHGPCAGTPFQSPEARRLALLFAIVYFAQGMIYLPDQVVAIVFKERGLTAGQLAAFTWITTIPWFIKPRLRPAVGLRAALRHAGGGATSCSCPRRAALAAVCGEPDAAARPTPCSPP